VVLLARGAVTEVTVAVPVVVVSVGDSHMSAGDGPT
jgi:acetamidase/formamidase